MYNDSSAFDWVESYESRLHKDQKAKKKSDIINGIKSRWIHFQTLQRLHIKGKSYETVRWRWRWSNELWVLWKFQRRIIKPAFLAQRYDE